MTRTHKGADRKRKADSFWVVVVLFHGRMKNELNWTWCSVKKTSQSDTRSLGAHTPLTLGTQTWRRGCGARRPRRRPTSGGYWMNGPQYCTEWGSGRCLNQAGGHNSMCTSPLRHGEQWDACTRPLLAYCRAGPLRPLGCLIKSTTITFTGALRQGCLQ